MSVDFIDSNVLVYLFDRQDPRKRQTAREIVERALRDDSGLISHQVVHETLNVIVRKAGLPISDAREFLADVLVPLWRVMPSAELFDRALSIQAKYQFEFYDSLIVSAGLISGASRLLSEDLQDGQQIEAITIVNPFRL